MKKIKRYNFSRKLTTVWLEAVAARNFNDMKENDAVDLVALTASATVNELKKISMGKGIKEMAHRCPMYAVKFQ